MRAALGLDEQSDAGLRGRGAGVEFVRWRGLLDAQRDLHRQRRGVGLGRGSRLTHRTIVVQGARGAKNGDDASCPVSDAEKAAPDASGAAFAVTAGGAKVTGIRGWDQESRR